MVLTTGQNGNATGVAEQSASVIQASFPKVAGLLVWWSMKSGSYNAQALKDAATSVDMPEWFVGEIVGKSKYAAWKLAAYVKGVTSAPLAFRNESSTGRYEYRTDETTDSNIRIISRYSVNRSGKDTGSEKVGEVSFTNDTLVVTPIATLHPELRKQVDTVAASMVAKFNAMSGALDDSDVRWGLVQKCTVEGHLGGISQRGSNGGGPYFITLPTDKAQAAETVALVRKLAKFIASPAVKGSLSIIAVHPQDETTDVSTIVASATDYLDSEVTALSERLDEISGLSAGRRATALATVQAKLAGLQQTVTNLADGLTDGVQLKQAELDMLSKKLEDVKSSAAPAAAPRKAKTDSEKETEALETLKRVNPKLYAALLAAQAAETAAAQQPPVIVEANPKPGIRPTGPKSGRTQL